MGRDAMVDLLAAREFAVKQILEAAGGGGEPPVDEEAYAGLLRCSIESAVSETAGQGFDAGYRYAKRQEAR